MLRVNKQPNSVSVKQAISSLAEMWKDLSWVAESLQRDLKNIQKEQEKEAKAKIEKNTVSSQQANTNSSPSQQPISRCTT
jgi:hypothetical protein